MTPEQRSHLMASIKSKDTRPEKRVRSLLHAMGFRFRIHRKDLPGTPDIVLPRYSTVIFVHGCFWHRHEGCKDCRLPKTNAEKWSAKFEANAIRDRNNIQQLENLGWRVLIVWECQTRDLEGLSKWLFEELVLDELEWIEG